MSNKLFRSLAAVMLTIVMVSTGMTAVYADIEVSEARVVQDSGKKAAAVLSVNNLWASEHSVGKVKFKWTAKSGTSVNGWTLKWRTRKIGGTNSWSGWTTKNYDASVAGGGDDKGAWITIPTDYVIEVHAQGFGDTTWSTGIITTPAGGKYQAMKNVRVKDTSTGGYIGSTIYLSVGGTIKVRPDYEYPVADFNKRPRLYPNQMLYDIGNKSKISISKPDGSAYTGGMIDGIATIKGVATGTTTLVFRAPNGRTKKVTVEVLPSGSTGASVRYPDKYVAKTISNPKVYTFDGSVLGTDEAGSSVRLQDVLATNENKKIILKGTIQFSERYRVGSNTEIDATMGQTGIGKGATIYSGSNGDGCLTNAITSGNYDSVKNVIIRGGTWKKNSGYHSKTMMLFTHASNIRIENIYEECAYSGHCVELVACKNVIVKNCNLKMKGTNPANNEDEPLQFDHANKVTSPTIPDNLKNNHACINMQVVGCTLQGGRGICSGHCGNDSTAQSYYHYSIVIQNCNITGQSSEAIALYNVVGCEISGNKTWSKNSDISSWRSDGVCVRIPEGSTAPADMKGSTVTIKNNTVYGGRSGIIVNSKSTSDFGKVVITGNKVYYKGTQKNAITVSRYYNNKSTAGCTSLTESGNTKTKGW